MSAQITTQIVDAYIMSWHKRTTGAEWDICPACTARIGLTPNHQTYPSSTPEGAKRRALEDMGGDGDYWCPECGKGALLWGALQNPDHCTGGALSMQDLLTQHDTEFGVRVKDLDPVDRAEAEGWNDCSNGRPYVNPYSWRCIRGAAYRRGYELAGGDR